MTPRYTKKEQLAIDRLLDLARDLLTGGYVPEPLLPPVVNFLATGDIGWDEMYLPYSQWADHKEGPAYKFIRALWLLSPFIPGRSLDPHNLPTTDREVEKIRGLMRASTMKNNTHDNNDKDETHTPDH